MKAFFMGLFFLPIWASAQQSGESFPPFWKKLPLSETSIVFDVRTMDNDPLAGASISILETRQLLITDQFGSCSGILPSTTWELHLLITRAGYAPREDTVIMSRAEVRKVILLKPWVEREAVPIPSTPCQWKFILI